MKKNSKLVLVILAILVILILAGSFKNSLIFRRRDRINIVFYGPQSLFISISRSNLNYYMYISPNDKVNVPGGFGEYRVGALGKLASLEKDPDLIRKTFSRLTDSFIDEYFYPAGDTVYYADQSNNERFWPDLSTFFTPGQADFLDRLYLAYLVFNTSKSSFTELSPSLNFIADYTGYLYQPIYRSERRNVQILYKNHYQTASSMSQLLAGEGINVADISSSSRATSGCLIVEGGKVHSVTASDLASYFRCDIESSTTDPYDILFYLGSLEKDWSI